MTAEHNTLPENRNALGLTRPVVLVGHMGAGKSTVGRRLAKQLGLPFVDSDDEIEQAAGRSISDIFELHGEAKFRDLEERILLRLLGDGPRVIGSGGGAFINSRIREAVKIHAVSVWLKADLDTLVERVSRKDTRPAFAKGDKRETAARLMRERNHLYAEADITIESDGGSHETVVKKIMERLAETQRIRSET